MSFGIEIPDTGWISDLPDGKSPGKEPIQSSRR
jgi:hypothetical protein